MGHLNKLRQLVLLLGGIVLLGLVHGKVHYHDFVLANINLTRLCETKSALVVNGQFPGPTIFVNKGDTVYVNVHNHGDYGFTIHWHGVKQPRNPWSDGPEYITQCPIEPGTNFTYEVVFSEEEGTLWWHAHSNWTRNTVHGAIVIYPDEGTTYPYAEPDGQEIIILGSWYTYDVNLVVEEDLEEGTDLPISSSYLINGQPGDFCECSKESTYRWQVDYGKTYLIRIVNAIMNAEVFFSIADHNFTVVGSDGAYLKPFVRDYIMIAPGQTIDLLITANLTPSHYYMAARQFYTDKAIFTEYDKTNVTAILEYRGNYTPPSSPSFPRLPFYTDYDAGNKFRQSLRSLANKEHPINVPMNITTRMFITTAVNQYFHNYTDDAIIALASSLNNISWINPTMDVLQAYYRNISGYYASDFPDEPPYYFDFVADDLGTNTTQPLMGTKVRVLEYNEEVEIIFQSTNVLNASEDHPMHLHGHSFYMVGQGGGIFDNETDPQTYNLEDPPYVNTASLPKNGWITIRFRANNPGVWLWHCHLDRHLSWGMNYVLIVKNGGTPESTIRDPPPYMPNCKGTSPLQLRAFGDEAELIK